MSAIAKVLLHDGVEITGSDLGENENVKTLKKMRVDIVRGHSVENIRDDHTLVIRSSAIKDDNIEVLEAEKKNIPVIKRSAMLGYLVKERKGICISGTHGKTSTTAIVGEVLEAGGLDPTIINGGIINNYNSNIKLGKGNYLVAESDESDGSFVDMRCKIAVVTNIEEEHMEFFKTFDNVKKYFTKFITQAIDREGIAVVCTDNETVREVCDKLPEKERLGVITYGFEDGVDYQAKNIKQTIDGLYFDVEKKSGKVLKNVFLPMYGIHQVQNSLVAIAIGEYLKMSEEEIINGLSKCLGVQRRFTKAGVVKDVHIIDDYAHHPTEVMATIKTAKGLVNPEKNRVLVVFQPHKYTRTQDLFYEFCHAFIDADILVLADIYSANQKPIKGVNRENLAKCIRNVGHKNVIELEDEKELPKVVAKNIKSGDIVLCLGAGTISDWSRKLPTQLKEYI
jgi:UDP-N-acetylmuramate--alanine ligase